jgi:hypothetical protein
MGKNKISSEKSNNGEMRKFKDVPRFNLRGFIKIFGFVVNVSSRSGGLSFPRKEKHF